MTAKALIERHGAVGVVTINRPEARNCIDAETAEALNRAFDQLEGDTSVRAVILTGAGDVAFSSGVDLKQLATEGPALIPKVVFPATGWAGIGKRNFSKPLIAAVNGYALAGGLELALSTDFIIASDNAIFGCNEVALGPIADAGACFRLAQWVPLPYAKQMLFTGTRVDAREAYRVGLVNNVVPLSRLLDEAVAVGQAIARNSPSSMRITKQLVTETLNLPEADAWAINDRYMVASFDTPDFMEGPRAFAQKRAPKWNATD